MFDKVMQASAALVVLATPSLDPGCQLVALKVCFATCVVSQHDLLLAESRTDPVTRLTNTLSSLLNAAQALSLERTYELEEEVEEELELLAPSKSEAAAAQAEASAALAAAANAEKPAASPTVDPAQESHRHHSPPHTQAQHGSVPIGEQQDHTPPPYRTEINPRPTHSSSSSGDSSSGSSTADVSFRRGASDGGLGSDRMDASPVDRPLEDGEHAAAEGGEGAGKGEAQKATLWQRWFGPRAS